jgi:hypothetical protein
MSGLFGDALVESAERILSREEFTAFAKALSDNLSSHPEEWQNATLAEFIRALAGFVEDMDGYYVNVGADVNCNLPSWRIFADVLLAARVYE